MCDSVQQKLGHTIIDHAYKGKILLFRLTTIISDVLLETLSVPSISGNSLHNHQVNIIRVKEVSTILIQLS